MLRRKLRNHPEYQMAMVGAVTEEGAAEELDLEFGGGIDEIEGLMTSGQIDHLVVRLDSSYVPEARVQELMHVCHREGLRFSCFPGSRSLLLPGVEINHVEGVGILTSNPPVLSRVSRTMKRGLDLGASALILTLASPVMALIALAVRIDSGGPVIYRQTRVGQHGKRFQLFKFRTMIPDAELLDDELMPKSVDPDWLVMERDPRVTRVGRFLRKNSLDELPQLWNVLKGEMSMVGPRPLSERDDRNVKGWKRHRLDLVPGVTGYWQVLGRNNMPFREMLEADYGYIANWSMWHDLKLLARTIPVVLLRRGAN
jgi:exopolysaccharide biosynthesis polyprenyl glycosylphosphotransferase